MQPPLYDEHEVLKRLKVQRRELAGLLDVGLIAPVARSMGQPMYCAEAIDRLSTNEQRIRLSDALWWDFDLQRPSYVPAHLPWAPAVDAPFYPFDSEKVQGWARRMYRRKKQCAPFPYPHHDRLERFRARMEDEATRAFRKRHGIKSQRKRKHRKLWFYRRHGFVDVSRAELRDIVWSKPMISAAADLGVSEFTLRKACRREQIPTPPRGHFNHKDPKQRMCRPALKPYKVRFSQLRRGRTGVSYIDPLDTKSCRVRHTGDN
jgi:hypothetical protein